MDPKMFCFQCQETAGNTGCLIKGVCGKEASTARLQDLLLFVVRGISVLERELRRHGQDIATEVYHFNTDALFCTITNANFDDESIAARVDRVSTSAMPWPNASVPSLPCPQPMP